MIRKRLIHLVSYIKKNTPGVVIYKHRVFKRKGIKYCLYKLIQKIKNKIIDETEEWYY